MSEPRRHDVERMRDATRALLEGSPEANRLLWDAGSNLPLSTLIPTVYRVGGHGAVA